MKKMHAMVLFAFCLGMGVPVYAKGPCKEKRKSMHAARLALRDCNKAWVVSLRGNSPDPADDCQAKQTAFVAGVKDYKACIQNEKAESK